MLLIGSSLQVHMTLNHGFPPPGSSISSDDQAEKGSDGGISTDPVNCVNEDNSTPMRQEIKEIKAMIGELRSVQNSTRVEQVSFCCVAWLLNDHAKFNHSL